MATAQLIGYQPLSLGFNSIPILKDHVDVHLTRDVLIKLGSIVRKHGLEGEVGITRVHRHFDLEPEEILVQSVSPDGSVSILSPWTLSNGQGLPTDKTLLEAHKMEVHGFIVPRTWKFTDDGVLTPCEYVNVNDPAAMTKFEFEPTFMQELYNVLLTLGWEAEVGITKLRKEKTTHGLETTSKAARCSTMIYVSNQEEAAVREGGVQVMWDFSINDSAWMCCVASCSDQNCSAEADAFIMKLSDFLRKK